MLARVLRILQRISSDVKIKVRRHHRANAETCVTRLDRPLLVCPPLVELEYTIIDSKDIYSDLKQLLGFLQFGAHCKSLRIDLTQAGQSFDRDPWDDVQFTLPSLETVAIISKGLGDELYRYDPSSLTWHIVDCQNLKRLETPHWVSFYGYNSPCHHDNFRNLRYFRTNIGEISGFEDSYLCSFLKNDALELYGLYIEDWLPEQGPREGRQFWSAVRKQRHSLRELFLPSRQRLNWIAKTETCFGEQVTM